MGKKKDKVLPRKTAIESKACDKNEATAKDSSRAQDIEPVVTWPTLDEAELVARFDSNLFAESCMPEEGIQAVRDMYLDVCILEKRIEKSMTLLADQHLSLQNENMKFSEAKKRDSDELFKLKTQKERLQALSEELNKNKDKLVEESKQAAIEEQNRRQAMNDQFSGKIKEITGRLEENGKSRIFNAEENERLKSELRAALDRYQALENEYDGKIAEIDQRVAVAAKKLADQDEITNKEKEIADYWQEKMKLMVESETSLRAQLSSYAGRFDEFQETLIKSNETFVGFKTRMEEMTKTVKVLESENSELSSKASVSNAALEAAVAKKQGMEAEVDKVRKQIEKLRALVNVMQSEIADKQRKIEEITDIDNNNNNNEIQATTDSPSC
eukprot:gene12400-26089_t